ncbi:heavy-metal-associated domain-containing protein [Agrobacterium tumefaciens]|uniref:Heavy-metal-associated domain-containing protein n=1 Tax=Agrobacterium tumefaciens TaxID=358 RepID=A0AA44F9Q9_AGRTU|nr:heavy-metal-associated domain-containing protein [Agrobacterium tumefaciens]NSY09623.1 heavy-metal-associated domain-containing protein [Agrobacterium tumefaciens]NSZ09323.1 heavy-metal-associated domain-containing protein [Agrobacterium tumefaciens]NTB87923.1 heavy-metal-associated domain-containing protein [Agrobacterium tumefaciens]NTC20071.1 heavy-metal-associated domain-containing protein [Agrobacterium tumefaciens]NTC31170.1 heavy-metal-associated domain-containing protein [Agrobacter
MYEFDIPNMTCGHCAGTVKKAIEQADPAASSMIDVDTKKAKVETTVSPEAIAAAINDAGYPTTYKSV